MSRSPGADRDVYFPTGGGDQTIIGEVRYADGSPASELSVLCYYKSEPGPPGRRRTGSSAVCRWAQTREGGTFVIPGVPATEFYIQIDPEGFVPGRPATENRLAQAALRKIADLSGGTGSPFDVGVIEVIRCRPCTIWGRVEIDWEGLGGREPSPDDLKVMAWAEPKSDSKPIRLGGYANADDDFGFVAVVDASKGTVWIEVSHWVLPRFSVEREVSMSDETEIDLGVIRIP